MIAAEVLTTTPSEVREHLLARREIALLDVREEAPHATGHPLFAANLPLDRVEVDAYTRLPRLTVPVVVMDNGEGLAERAAKILTELGYTDVRLLEGGLQGWKDAGYQIFIDVNAPSKAFGELVEEELGTPSLSAQDVQRLIDEKADYVMLDVRRFDEFQTMSIPTGVSVPGAELVLRVQDLAPRPETQVIVNCAGRTRSILGAQSLINASIPNPVAALRNGAIGWRLAKQSLAHGEANTFGETSEETRSQSESRAKAVAARCGVRDVTTKEVDAWRADLERTTYLFDVRTPQEFEAGHLHGFKSTPGGQLVQETEMNAPVRGARIVLTDTDGVRSRMTASWLAQMGWEVYALPRVAQTLLTAPGPACRVLPDLPAIPQESRVSYDQVREAMGRDEMALLDFSPSGAYRKSHYPDAWYASRLHLEEVLECLKSVSTFVVTSNEAALAAFAWRDLAAQTPKRVLLLNSEGSTAEKISAAPRFACEAQDRYRRPYEGTEANEAAMQGYLDWEAGLVQQLELDGTHHFRVVPAES